MPAAGLAAPLPIAGCGLTCPAQMTRKLFFAEVDDVELAKALCRGAWRGPPASPER